MNCFVTTEVCLRWSDRLRVLLGGRVCVRTVIRIDEPAQPVTLAWVPPLLESPSERDAHRRLEEWIVVR